MARMRQGTKVAGIQSAEAARIQNKAIALECFYFFGFASFSAFNVSSLLEIGWTPAAAAHLVLWTSILTLVCQPLLGRLADRRWGEKKLVTRALLVFALNLLLLPLCLRSGARWTVVLSILVSTFFGTQMMNFIDAWLIGLKQDYPAFNYGLMRGIGSVAFAVAALSLGPLSSRFGFELRYYLGATSIFLAVLTSFLLPAPGHRQPALETPLDRPGTKESLRELSRIPSYPLLILSVFLINVGQTSLMTLNPVILTELGGTATHIGIYFALNAFVEMPMMVYMGKVYPRTRASSVFLIAGLVYALRLFLCGTVTTIPAFLVIQLLQGVSFAILMPTAMSYLGEILPERARVTGIALYASISSAGAGIFSNFLNSVLLADGLRAQALIRGLSLSCLLGCALIVYGQKRHIW